MGKIDLAAGLKFAADIKEVMDRAREMHLAQLPTIEQIVKALPILKADLDAKDFDKFKHDLLALMPVT